MEKDELLDLVNEEGKVIGTASRSQCHNNKDLIHQVSHCWIFNKKGEVLWQQRSYTKEGSPGKWDMSCGGHVPHGEKPEETLKRELNEELGLKNAKFKLVDKYIQKFPSQTEFIYLFYSVINKDTKDFKIDRRETQQIKWIDPYKAQLEYVNRKVESTEFIISELTRILQKIFSATVGK